MAARVSLWECNLLSNALLTQLQCVSLLVATLNPESWNSSIPQYLSMMVQRNDLKGQARAFSTLAGLYEETEQLTKAREYYKKVCTSFFSPL